MVTNHGVNHDKWYTADGFRGGLTTIRPKGSRKVHHNRFEGNLARCSIYDLSQNRIVSDESVINGSSYQLIYTKGIYILEPKGECMKLVRLYEGYETLVQKVFEKDYLVMAYSLEFFVHLRSSQNILKFQFRLITNWN